MFATFTLGMIVPIHAFASDFVVLQVGLGAFIIAGLLIFMGVKALSTKSRETTISLMLLILGLATIGIGIVNEESSHMSNYDYFGLLGIILLSGVFAFVVSLFTLIKATYNTPEKEQQFDSLSWCVIYKNKRKESKESNESDILFQSVELLPLINTKNRRY